MNLNDVKLLQAQRNMYSTIVNNENLSEFCFPLWERWQDEKEYEDIKDYAKALFDCLKKLFPQYDMQFLSASKRPFGVKFTLNGIKTHLFVKCKGNALMLMIKSLP